MVLYSFFSGGVLYHLVFIPISLKRKSHNEKWNIFGCFFLNIQINLSIIALVTSGHVAGYQGQLSYHPSPLFPDRWIFLLLPENTICPLPHLAWIPYLRQDDEHVEMLLSRLNVSHIVVSVWLGLSPAQTLPVEAETLLLQIFTRQHCCLSSCEYLLSLTNSDYSEKIVYVWA